MSFSQVQVTSVATGSTGLTLSATGSGNLLVVYYADELAAGGGESFSAGGNAMSLAISQQDTTGSNDGYAAIYYLADTPSGITSITISGSSTNSAYMAIEYSGAATTSPLDVTGTATYTSGTSLSVSTSQSASAGDLACSAISMGLSSSTKLTLSAGTGFTQEGQQNNGTKATTHVSFDDNLDVSPGTVTDAASSGTSFSGGAAAVIATFLPAPPPATGIYVDVSTPALVDNQGGSSATVTTASFTPPANSLLLVMYAGNSSSSSDSPGLPTITDNLGTHLTYNLIQNATDSTTGQTSTGGQSVLWWASVTTSAAMTVSCTSQEASAFENGLQVVVLMRADPVNPVGSSGVGDLTTGSTSHTQSYTAGSTGGMGFMAMCDFNNSASANPTAATGCTLISGPPHSTAHITYANLRRTTADDVSGVSNNVGWGGWPGGADACLWAWADINTLAGPLVSQTTLPAAMTGQAYSTTLTATGGTSPYTWSISSGSLPSWASLNSSTGVISGTPPSGSLEYPPSFTVEVTDAASNTGTQVLSIQVGQLLESAWPGYPAPSLFVPGELIFYSTGTLHAVTVAADVAVIGVLSRKITRVLTAVTIISGTVTRKISHALITLLVVTGTALKQLSRSLAANVVAAASLTAVRHRIAVLVASLTATVSTQRTVGRILAGTAAVTGTLGRSISRTIAASAVAPASVLRAVSRTISGASAVAAAVVTQKFKIVTLTALTVASAAVPRVIGKPVVGQVTISGFLVRNIARVVAAVTAAAASVTRVIQRPLTAVSAVTGIGARSVLLSLSSVIAVTSSLTRSVLRTVTGLVTVFPLVTRSVGRVLAASTVVAATVSLGARALQVMLTSAVTVTSAVSLSTGRIISGAVTVAPAVSTLTKKIIFVTTAVTVVVVRGISRTLVAFTVVTAAVSMIKVKEILLVAAVAAKAAVTRTTGRVVTASAAVAAGITSRITQVISATTITMPMLSRNIGHAVVSLVAVTVSTAQIKLKTVFLAASVAATSFISRNSSFHLSAYAIVVSGTTRTIFRAIQGNLSVAGQTLRTVGRGLTTVATVFAAQTASRLHIIALSTLVSVSVVVTRGLGAIQAASVACSVAVGKFIRKTVVSVAVFVAQVSSGAHEFFMTFTTSMLVAPAVRAQIVNIFTVTVKIGLSFVNWVVGQLKKDWRIP